MLIRPAIISNLDNTAQSQSFLNPVPLDTPPYNEAWLQNLIQKNPDLIPAAEIEPCFTTLVPIVTEYTLPSGSLDNLFITADGYPVLVEVKLWKNQESRRKVVAQIVEYAMDFSTLTYQNINDEYVRKNPAAKNKENPLYEAVSAYAPNTPSESVFVDRVSRNIREGRFLLLILGDGIREELGKLAEHLLHHSLRYAFGLVQIKLFETPGGGFLVLPSVIGKTQTVERHVTVINTPQNNVITTPSAANAVRIVSEHEEKTSLSTDQFYESLAESIPAAVPSLKTLLKLLDDIPVELSIGTTDYATLIAPISGGGSITLLLINAKGKSELWGLPNKKRRNAEWKDIAQRYLSALSAIVPGSFVKTFDSGHMDLYNQATGKSLSFTAFIGKEEALAEAMRSAIVDARNFLQKDAA